MYLKIILALLLVVTATIAVRVWRPPASSPPEIIAGEIPPYGVWPHDKVGVDRTLEKRIDYLVVDAKRLDEALTQVRQKSGVNIIWNAEDLPVMSGEPIQRVYRNVTVEEAITDLLALGLRPPPIGTRDGIVVIHSDASVLRFYDVRGVFAGRAGPSPSQSQPAGSALFGSATEAEREADELLELLTQALAAAGINDDLVARSSVWDRVLIVRASPRAHRVIIKHLETLRSVR